MSGLMMVARAAQAAALGVALGVVAGARAS